MLRYSLLTGATVVALGYVISGIARWQAVTAWRAHAADVTEALAGLAGVITPAS
jgi:uncharacterized membrane protein